MKNKLSNITVFLWLAGFLVLLLAAGKNIYPKIFHGGSDLPVLGQVVDFKLKERSGK